MQSDDDTARLARFTLAHQRGWTVSGQDAVDGIIGALDRDHHDKLLDLPGRDTVTDEDTLAGLRLVHAARRYLDRRECDLIEAAKDRGVTWERLGVEAANSGDSVFDKPLSAQAMQQRYKRLGGERTWPTSRPRRTDPGADEQPGALSAAQHFPHHPHLLAAKKRGNKIEYSFRPFTGDEPEPQRMEYPKPYEREEDQSAADKAMWTEWIERNNEIEAAHKLWEEARYNRQITPLIFSAIEARPPVDEALAELARLWAELDNAPVWPGAVKHLLDAQDKAQTELDRWVDEYAYPLAQAEGSQSSYITEHVAHWRRIAEKIAGQPVNWGIGSYYKGDKRTPASYDDDPRNELAETIRQQRARLEEITQLSGTEGEGQQ